MNSAETGGQATKEHAAETIEALAGMSGGFAHDVNNLLTVIRGSAEMLERAGSSAAAQHGHIRAIIDAADRTTKLTQQLLAFARKQPLRPQPLRIADLMTAVRDDLSKSIGTGIRLRIMVPESLHLVLVDPLGLASAIRAAVENAREAMPDGGVLTITATNVDGGGTAQVRLAIVDSGSGMAPDVAGRAFEPFFTTKAVGAGSGLGLAQVHGFAAQSGGRTTIDSAPGRGTTLTIVLPAASGVQIAEAAPAPAAPPAAGTRVLLVEDSNTVAAFAEALLADLGCAVTRAACATEALDHLAEAQGRFDIMFSDIVMPGMSGLDLAEQVRRDHPRLPILLATGHSEQVARGGSAFPVLPKPYRRDALVQMMGCAMAA